MNVATARAEAHVHEMNNGNSTATLGCYRNMTNQSPCRNSTRLSAAFLYQHPIDDIILGPTYPILTKQMPM